MANIRDVAKRAGVSTATVSKVLNNKPDVSEATRAKVMQAVRELNYTSNIHARRLFSKKNKTIGVVFFSRVSYVVYTKMFEGINRRTMEQGFDVLTFDEDYLLSRSGAFSMEEKVDGLIILGRGFSQDKIEAIKSLSIPYVLCPESVADLPATVVSPDNHSIARIAVNYLIAKGHTRIGFVGSSKRYWFSSTRFDGYLSSLAAHNLPIDSQVIVDGFEPFYEGGYEAGKQILEVAKVLPTALFAVNDFMAMGVAKYLKEHNIRVPEDISIVGCDDIALAEYFEPPLTTVKIPWEQVGILATDTLMKIIKKEPVSQSLLLLNGQLVERKSVVDISGKRGD